MSSSAEEDLLQQTLTGQLPQSVQLLFNETKQKGNEAFRQSNYQQAIDHYNTAESINPMSPVPPANRALVYLKLEQYKRAKDESTVALELHKALPSSQRTNSLAVKILLRRATANKNLMLLSLAADDYQQVLTLENDNHAAQQELNQLSEKHNIRPTLFMHRPNAQNTNQISPGQARISVMQDVSITDIKSNGERVNGHPIPIKHSTQLEDETALLQLHKQDLDQLLSTVTEKAPRSPSDFEHTWKYLKSSKLSQGKYLLHTVGSERIANGILGETLTPHLFDEIVNVMVVAIEHDHLVAQQISQVLYALTKVSRFDILRMFFGDNDKQRMFSLLTQLQNNSIPSHQVNLLKEMYT